MMKEIEALDGRTRIELDGLSYLPKFITAEEAEELAAAFGQLNPIWEARYEHANGGGRGRRLTRPVYWLGAWQFASLGYYSEPDHREHRCVRGEPLWPLMTQILERLRPVLATHDCRGLSDVIPNTCLINYYGSQLSDGPPVDKARLRFHKDGEPGPIILFYLGQPGLLAFADPDDPRVEGAAVWTRHRSVAIFSGSRFKDTLYHQVVRVRHGKEPVLPCPVDNFSLRRISVSFRHVPEALISDFGELPEASQELVRPYIEELATSSPHYAAQLNGLKR